MEVATVVASIISAFGNGRDLFRRMTGKKLKRKGREPTLSEAEAWLRDSLHQRPLEIGKSYRHHLSKHGQRYEMGDSIAHASLAHTLLALNSGLIKLINQALSKSSKTHEDDLSRRSLFSLSEVAAADTLNALSQLSFRLNSYSQLALRAPPRPPKVKETETTQEMLKLKGGSGGRATPKKRPGPAPLLVRGGWVRPKSSSVVSASSSNSNSSKSGSSKHQRSTSEPLLPASAPKKHSSHQSREPIPVLEPVVKTAPIMNRQRSQSDLPRPHRQPSMLIVPSNFFLSQSQPLPPQEYQAPPPRPPKIPLHSRPNPNLNARPKSSHTMKSVSTKIGEIPDRYSQTLRPVEEQTYDPRLVEYLMSTPDGMPPEQPKKRGRGFRFWRKEEDRQTVAAH